MAHSPSSKFRPSKHSLPPAPFYVTHPSSAAYCHACGRIISQRKTQQTTMSSSINDEGGQVIKYCSARCRSRKPGSLDRKIERTFVRLLMGEMKQSLPYSISGESRDECNKKNQKKLESYRSSEREKKRKSETPSLKGRIASCDEIQAVVFGSETDSDGDASKMKYEGTDPCPSDEEEKWRSIDLPSGTDYSLDGHNKAGGAQHAGLKLAAVDELKTWKGSESQAATDTTGPADLTVKMGTERGKRIEGQRRAEKREMVRRAARRGVVFGFAMDEVEVDQERKRKRGGEYGGARRKCEAVVNGVVVEPSFAKGNWGIRWRDER